MSKRIIHVVGCRPNFVKAAPVYRALAAIGGFEQEVIHTGQHYDDGLSVAVIRDVQLPITENLHSSDLSAIKAGLMTRIVYADAVIVYGDVHSTLAAALAAREMGRFLVHVEAGLRSGDWSMPEEINRFVVDSAADVLFTTEPAADTNLRREMIHGHIVRVGNVLADSIKFAKTNLKPNTKKDFKRFCSNYGVVTLHRPSNVDNEGRFYQILDALESVLKLSVKLKFVTHPRVKLKYPWKLKDIELLKPLGYNDMLAEVRDSRFVITDSGGLQEETTILGIPCLTVRPNTERPITVEAGTNTLVEPHEIWKKVEGVLINRTKGALPDLWDGHASDRIAKWLKDFLG